MCIWITAVAFLSCVTQAQSSRTRFSLQAISPDGRSAICIQKETALLKRRTDDQDVETRHILINVESLPLHAALLNSDMLVAAYREHVVLFDLSEKNAHVVSDYTVPSGYRISAIRAADKSHAVAIVLMPHFPNDSRAAMAVFLSTENDRLVEIGRQRFNSPSDRIATGQGEATPVVVSSTDIVKVSADQAEVILEVEQHTQRKSQPCRSRMECVRGNYIVSSHMCDDEADVYITVNDRRYDTGEVEYVQVCHDGSIVVLTTNNPFGRHVREFAVSWYRDRGRIVAKDAVVGSAVLLAQVAASSEFPMGVAILSDTGLFSIRRTGDDLVVHEVALSFGAGCD